MLPPISPKGQIAMGLSLSAKETDGVAKLREAKFEIWKELPQGSEDVSYSRGKGLWGKEVNV